MAVFIVDKWHVHGSLQQISTNMILGKNVHIYNIYIYTHFFYMIYICIYD